MAKNKTGKMFFLFLLMLVLFAGTVLIQNVHTKLQMYQQGNVYYPEKRDLYNNYGLKNGEVLSDAKLAEDENLVVYADRVFYINQIDQTQVSNIVNVAKTLRERMPEIEKFYIMPVPGRAVLENGYEKESADYEDFIKKLEGDLLEDGKVLNPLPELKNHQDEFLYFRTDNNWTMRGAFYGAQVILKELGYEEENLMGYREYLFGDFTGNLKSHALKQYQDSRIEPFIEEIENDEFYIYIKGTNPNREELTFTDSLGQRKTLKRSMIQFNSMGNGAVIGDDYEHSVVEGMGEGNLLLLTDSYGKMLISYLSELFEKIYVVNIYEDSHFAQNLEQIMLDYDISQVLWAQDAAKMGDASYMNALNPFLQKGGGTDDTDHSLGN